MPNPRGLPADHPLRDPDWCRRAYLDQNRAASDIGQQLDLSMHTVLRYLRMHGIEIRAQGANAGGSRAIAELADADWVRAHYIGQGKTAQEIAGLLGCSHTAIYKALKRHGIQARGRGDTSAPASTRDGRTTLGATLHEALEAHRENIRAVGPPTTKLLASRVREVGRAAATSNRYHLRNALLSLAACAIEWADRLPAPRA